MRRLARPVLALTLLAAAAREGHAGWEDDGRAAFLGAQRSPDWKTRKLGYVAASDHDGAGAAQALLQALAGEAHPAVVGAGLDSLAGFRTKEGRAALVEAARRGTPEVRVLAVAALSGHRAPEVDGALAAALAGPEPRLAAQAALVLSEGERARPVPALLSLLASGDRRTRGAVARALGAAKDRAAVAPLAALLATEEGHARLEVVRALEAIAGAAHGDSPARWKAVAEGKDPAAVKETARLFPTAFGIPVAGERVAFVLDRSLLMGDAHPFDRARLEALSTPLDGEPIPWFRLKTKLQFAIAQVTHAVDALRPGARFEVVYFAEDVKGTSDLRWSPVNAGSRKALAAALAAIEPDDGINVYGALEAALALGGPSDAAAWKAGPDEVFLVTNNLPNKGDVVDAGELAAAMGWRARLRQVPVHVIGIGNHPYALAEALAKRTGGTYLSLVK